MAVTYFRPIPELKGEQAKQFIEKAEDKQRTIRVSFAEKQMYDKLKKASQ